LTCWSDVSGIGAAGLNHCLPAFSYVIQVDAVDVQFAAISPQHGGDNYDRTDFIALGARVNNDDASVVSCSMSSMFFEGGTVGPCADGFFTQGQLLSRKVTVSHASDTVTVGIIARNMEGGSAQTAGVAAGAALQDASAGTAGISGIIAVPCPVCGAVGGVISAGLAIAGTFEASPKPQDGRSHPSSVDCSGGLVSDLPNGFAADTLYLSLTGDQLRDATANGPAKLDIPLHVVAPTGLCRSDQVIHLSITRQ
jgi:hypothetical protein